MARRALESLPFFVVSPILLFWLAPFVASTTLGNDYPIYSIQSQIELFFSLERGSFPLFVPGYYVGQTSSALPLGQIFHPISHIASSLPGYWDGFALEINTLLRLLELGLCQLLLFRFLRGVRFGYPLAFLLSLVTVYNLKMLDLFRFGASLESWTSHLMLCSAIGLYWLKPSRWLSALLIGSTYLLICSGHPEMLYFGLVGAGFFTLATPFFVAEMLQERGVGRARLWHFYRAIGGHCACGIVLSAAFLVPFYFDFLAVSDRSHSSYRHVGLFFDTQGGLLSNFFVPLRAGPSGAIGGSCLILIGLLAPALKVFRVRVPAVIWLLGSALFVTYLAMLGKGTPVHYWMWKFLPFFSELRASTRISLYVPILLLLLTAWVMRRGASKVTLPGGLRIPPPTLLALIALLLNAVYFALPESITLASPTSPWVFRQVPEWVPPTLLAIGSLFFIVLACRGFLFSPRWRSFSEISLCMIAMVQITSVLYFGTWVGLRAQTPHLAEMLEYKKKSLDYPFQFGAGMSGAALPPKELWFSQRIPGEAYLAKIYRDPLVAKSRSEVFRLMLETGKRRVRRPLILEDRPAARPLRRAISDSGAYPDAVDLVYSSFNRLLFDVEAAQPGILTLNYPYTGHWRAWVDEEKVEIFRANGYLNAIQVEAGHSRVEFRYESWAAVLGMAVSSATLAMVGLWLLWGIRSSPMVTRALLTAAVAIFCAGGFWVWRQSLYSGDNLETAYHWDPSLENNRSVAPSGVARRRLSNWPCRGPRGCLTPQTSGERRRERSSESGHRRKRTVEQDSTPTREIPGHDIR